MTNFDALLATLARREVAFILVGGAAAIAHGSARLTQDLQAKCAPGRPKDWEALAEPEAIEEGS
jgi:hypothetical protein